MQITHNAPEVSRIVLEYIQSSYNLDDSNDFNVEANEDGSITVYVNEEVTTSEASPTPTGERPTKKPRRTKAQIEADNKAEAERLAQATAAGANGGEDTSGNAVASTEQAAVETPAVVAEAAGETTQEPSAPGEKDPSLDTAVVVEEPAADPIGGEIPAETTETVEEPAAVEEPVTPKPTTSLFANLRKPNNQ